MVQVVFSSTGDVLEMSVVRGVGGVCVFWFAVVGGSDQGRQRWGGVMSVWGVSPDSLCRWQVQVYVYCAWRIPAHPRCTPCSIQLVRMAGMPENGKSGPHCWGREGLTQFAQQLVSAVTAPPLVGCVVWSLKRYFPTSLVAPLPNSEQINHPSSNHTFTKSTTNHIHHHYAPSVTLTHTTHIISSTAPIYVPHCHPWICGQTPLE